MAAVEAPVKPTSVHEYPHLAGRAPPAPLATAQAAKDVPARNAANVDSDNVAEQPAFQLEEHPIDEVRPIKVGVIGAGLTGITAGVLLPIKVPGLDLRIYDKNADVGGTWYENTYPGLRCDVPAHAYQSGFEPNTQWTEEFAQGHEIRDYWQGVAKKYDVYKYLRLKQKVQQAEWIPDKAKWRLTLEDLNTSSVYEEELDIIINALGHFNAWKLPEYEGIDQFQGTLFHSSNWDHNAELAGKRIALIGNGASGLQVLPSIQPLASHVDHYARNRTWVAGSFGETGVRRLEPNLFSPEQLEAFKDPDTYLEYRRSVERGSFQRFGSVFKGSPENESLREQWSTLMRHRTAEDPSLADKIIPDFPPICRRPTPGPGYLEALAKPNVDFIQTQVARFTPTGIETTDGVHRPVDVVICSTGAHVDHAPPFPLKANGYDLHRDWKPDHPDSAFGFPYSYLGVAAPSFPNALWLSGAYSAGYSGTVPNSIENQVTYVAKVLRKVRGQNIRTFVPSKAATEDFARYCDQFYGRTVWSADCSSWYKGGRRDGKIHGLFPGSATMSNIIRREPRWEDFEYTYVNESNRFAYFGNGWTKRELPGAESDLTPHLRKPEDIDLRTYLEGWWDV